MSEVTLTKGDLTKVVTNKGNIELLKADGWAAEGDKAPSKRDELKVEAAELGLEHAGNIPTVKLEELIESAKES